MKFFDLCCRLRRKRGIRPFVAGILETPDLNHAADMRHTRAGLQSLNSDDRRP